MKKIIVNLAGVGSLICKRKLICDKGDKMDYLKKDEFGSIIPNQCGIWCCRGGGFANICILSPRRKQKSLSKKGDKNIYRPEKIDIFAGLLRFLGEIQ